MISLEEQIMYHGISAFNLRSVYPVSVIARGCHRCEGNIPVRRTSTAGDLLLASLTPGVLLVETQAIPEDLLSSIALQGQ